ncbi:MAG: methanogenesis marker 8 protein [Actinomycetota bacterium]|nr:methanogenesis marker 8 protein [Actinomycetota bacterium]
MTGIIKVLPGKSRDIEAVKKYIINNSYIDSYPKDIHIIRFYSSYVAISNGRVIKVTKPYMKYCPLAGALYRGINSHDDTSSVRGIIKEAIESKISEFGFFTGKRVLWGSNISIPFGASEILMYALRKGAVDAAVVVCDGAGTVIADKPEVVQGIGARMNGIFHTSSIEGVIKKLEKTGAHVVFEDGTINQLEGVEKAADSGYRNIAVTINASMDVPLNILRKMEKNLGISLTSLAICTTGIDRNRIMEIVENTDIVWSCASEELREIAGKRAIMQLSMKIPVFVLTKKGLGLIDSYSPDKNILESVNQGSQYLIAGSVNKGKAVRIGNFKSYLSKAELPVRHGREPLLNTKE